MTTDDKNKDENLQLMLIKKLPLLSGKVNKYEFLKGKKYCNLIEVEQ